MDSATLGVQADFERLAAFGDGRWDHNQQYHRRLLRFLPPRRSKALDLGCGTGRFARCLAGEFERVVAIDLAPEMIRRARDLSQSETNIEFRAADFTARDLPADEFDCIATIATLHHLPAEETLRRLATALRPGGALLVLDLYRPHTAADWLWNALAVPADLLLRVWKLGRLQEPPHVRRAWAEHARHDKYPTLSEMRSIAARLLPGATVRRHLFWRYSLVWQKPST